MRFRRGQCEFRISTTHQVLRLGLVIKRVSTAKLNSKKWLISSAAKFGSHLFRLAVEQGNLLLSHCSRLVLSSLENTPLCVIELLAPWGKTHIYYFKICRDVEHAPAQWPLEGRKINTSACLKQRQEKDRAQADQGFIHLVRNDLITTQPLLMGPRHVQRILKWSWESNSHNFTSLISCLYVPPSFSSSANLTVTLCLTFCYCYLRKTWWQYWPVRAVRHW